MTANSNPGEPPRLLYRFRPLSRLLDSGELERQEIYFASPAQLNDPMEGFRDVFWRGDLIAWQNLFKHYLRCLEAALFQGLVVGVREAITWERIPVVGPSPEHEALPGEALLARAFRAFLDEPAIKGVLAFLASRESPVGRDELRDYCSMIHMFAMSVLWTEFEAHGIQPAGSGVHLREAGAKSLAAVSALASDHAVFLAENPDPALTRALFAERQRQAYQLGLVDSLLAREGLIANREFLFRWFPVDFPDQLERLVYPDWRVACFMADAVDASLWGTYGDRHTGVCLMFQPRVEAGRATIALNRVVGHGPAGPIKEWTQEELHQVQYTNRFPEIDFFRSIGRLPAGQLLKHWHSDGEGRMSSCALAGETDWRDAYWQAFYPGITTKLEDWSGEREFRAILSGFMADFSQPEQCTARYDFDSLVGLVFGMKTPVAQRLEIVKIIARKCAAVGRREFKFYEARYSHDTGRFEHVELPLIALAFDAAGASRIAGA